MEITWDTTVLDLNSLMRIARGDQRHMEKYLRQFRELTPQRIALLQESLKEGKRKTIRQILHQMSPQLNFFGIPDIQRSIRRLEYDYESIPWEDLQLLINEILHKLYAANEEIERILDTHFSVS